MRFTHLSILLYFLLFLSCKHQKPHIFKIEGTQIPVSDSIAVDLEIENFIKPYRHPIDKDLNRILTYSADTYSKTNGLLNTAIGNYMADAVYMETNPIFNKRTGLNIDIVLLNHGGIRAPLPKGNISTRNAYHLMPFENNVVVVVLKGSQIDSLIHYLSKSKRAHPISKLKLILDHNFEVVEATINNLSIKKNKTYNVATSDYLLNGGDNMIFFKNNDTVNHLNYKIRNILIDNFKKVDTINPVIDDRFIQIK